MDDFKADRWPDLSNAERIELCRIAARDAEADAKSAELASRHLYKNLAAQWLMLAAEIERHGDGPSQESSSSISP